MDRSIMLIMHTSFRYFVSTEKDEEGYLCTSCTVFGLEDTEAKYLAKSGFSLINNGNTEEGYEVKSSAYKVRFHLSNTEMWLTY